MSRAKAYAFAVPLLSAALLAGCASTQAKEEAAAAKAVEEAMAAELAPATAEEIEEVERADALTQANFWAAEFRKDPTKLDVTIKFTEALRAIGSHERAIEVLSKAIPVHPASAQLHMVMGRALMSEGRPSEAAEVFYRAATLAPETAAPHAALGLSLDQLERHHDAQTAYATALEIEPDRISTLTNSGLSLALSGELDAAEERLRYAASLPAADARVRQNLALILGLQGRFTEMRAIDPHAPTRTVEANLETLKSMLAPTRDYGVLRDDAGADEEMPAPMETPQREEAAAPPELRGSLSR